MLGNPPHYEMSCPDLNLNAFIILFWASRTGTSIEATTFISYLYQDIPYIISDDMHGATFVCGAI